MDENKNEFQQETDAVKAVKEELMAQINELKNNYESQINTMRSEHAAQLREVLRSGTAASAASQEHEDEDDVDEDGISAKAVQAQIDLLNKKLQRF